MKLPIYMDYHATTPVDARVFEAMRPYFCEKFGNSASSSHSFGWEAKAAVEQARRQVAESIGASSSEIVFTSGGTESDNLAVKGAVRSKGDLGLDGAVRSKGDLGLDGAARKLRHRGDHVVTCVTEHKAVLDACRTLEQEGFRVTYLPVDRQGRLDPGAVAAAITEKTVLVSLMAANNEIGVLHPIAEIGRLCRERGVLFHCDATQAIGRIAFDVKAAGIDLAAFTAHKFYGPKGAGALYVREGVKLQPLLDGGGHERGLRSGTMNVPGIVGLGAACELARREQPEESQRILQLKNRLHDAIVSRLEGVVLNGHPTERLAGNLNLCFPVDGQELMMGLKDVAVSGSAACNSTGQGPSSVLTSIGLSEEMAGRSLRFGLGRFTTAEEVDYAAARVVETVTQLRELSLT